MRASRKRLVIELVATAAAAPTVLLILLIMHAFTVIAIIAYPTLPLMRVLGNLELPSWNARGGLIPGFGAGLEAELFILPVWTWIQLMILVKLFEVGIQLFERVKTKRGQS